jgi:hypothetical protein
MTAAVTFRPTHELDRTFFLGFVAVCWFGVAMGFVPALSARFAGKADYAAPLILHLHALAFIAWLALLTSQTLLIAARRTALHRRLGQIGFGLVPVMVVSALTSEVYSQRFYFTRDPHDRIFFIVPIFYGLMFGALATAALLKRRDPPTHKRLILVATTVIVGAAYTRWIGEALTAAVDDGPIGMIVNTFLAANVILALALGYDVVTRGRPHPAYVWSTGAVLLGQALTSFIYHAAWWPAVAVRLIGA